VGLVEKIIAEIDSGWSPRVAARKAGTTEYMLSKLSRESKELRIKMDIYNHYRIKARCVAEGTPAKVEISFVDRRRIKRKSLGRSGPNEGGDSPGFASKQYGAANKC
jgi:hypothetical protein